MSMRSLYMIVVAHTQNAVSDVKKVLIANKLDAVQDAPEKRQVSTRQGMQVGMLCIL